MACPCRARGRLGRGDARAGDADPSLDQAGGIRMSTTNTLLVIWLAAAWLMAAGWAWQRRQRNAGIVDVLWSVAVGGAAILAALVGSGAPGARLLMAGRWRRLG